MGMGDGWGMDGEFSIHLIAFDVFLLHTRTHVPPTTHPTAAGAAGIRSVFALTNATCASNAC